MSSLTTGSRPAWAEAAASAQPVRICSATTELPPMRESNGARLLCSAARGHSIECITHALSLPMPWATVIDSPPPTCRLAVVCADMSKDGPFVAAMYCASRLLPSPTDECQGLKPCDFSRNMPYLRASAAAPSPAPPPSSPRPPPPPSSPLLLWSMCASACICSPSSWGQPLPSLAARCVHLGIKPLLSSSMPNVSHGTCVSCSAAARSVQLMACLVPAREVRMRRSEPASVMRSV